MPGEEKRRLSQWTRTWGRVLCAWTGVASLILILVAFVSQLGLDEKRLGPLIATAAAFVLQAVCGTLAWKNIGARTHPTLQPGHDARASYSWDGRESSMSKGSSLTKEGGAGAGIGATREGGGAPEGAAVGSAGRPVAPYPVSVVGRGLRKGSGSSGREIDVEKNCVLSITSMEHGTAGIPRGVEEEHSGVERGVRAERRAGHRVGVVEDEEESFTSHIALETPLQQAARMLEFVLERYNPELRIREKLEMVLNIISLPEDLNMVTMQSIISADLDTSTTEWIEAQLSTGSSGPSTASGEHFTENKGGDAAGMDTGMTSNQLRRQQEVGQACNAEKGPGRTKRHSSNFNVSQLMTLPGARVGRVQTLVEVEECTQDDVNAEEDASAGQRELEDLMPTWPGIHPEAQKRVVNMIAAKHFLDWEFDVFQLQELSGGHSLWYSGMMTLYHYNYVGVFNICPTRLSNFLMHVEHNYCFDPDKPNPYHTAVHAADVTLTVAHFCENEIIASGIKALQGFALLVAAIVHDYRHRGVNNGFLVKVRDNLAITYNDASVLENFHLAEAFQVLYDEKANILQGLTTDEHRQFRQFVVKTVLATDLAHGFEYVARFTASTNTKGGRRASIVPDMGRDDAPGDKGGAPGAPPKDPLQAQILLMQMVIKVADVAHPMKPWKLHEKWTNLITEEFHRQGDLEIEMGVPVSPLCGRDGHNPAKSQCDFISFVVRPCATAFSSFCQDQLWVATLESNFRRWSEMAGQP